MFNSLLATKEILMNIIEKTTKGEAEDEKEKELITSGGVRLLMEISDNNNNNNNIDVHFDEDNTSGENYIHFESLHFRINKKALFRVYSRNSWLKHGRWYGGL